MFCSIGDEVFPFAEYKQQESSNTPNTTDQAEARNEGASSKTGTQTDGETSETEKCDELSCTEQRGENSTDPNSGTGT